jgi:hypothetical protein
MRVPHDCSVSLLRKLLQVPPISDMLLIHREPAATIRAMLIGKLRDFVSSSHKTSLHRKGDTFYHSALCSLADCYFKS